jgi:hypothetical protein
LLGDLPGDISVAAMIAAFLLVQVRQPKSVWFDYFAIANPMVNLRRDLAQELHTSRSLCVLLACPDCAVLSSLADAQDKQQCSLQE